MPRAIRWNIGKRKSSRPSRNMPFAAAASRPTNRSATARTRPDFGGGRIAFRWGRNWRRRGKKVCWRGWSRYDVGQRGGIVRVDAGQPAIEVMPDRPEKSVKNQTINHYIYATFCAPAGFHHRVARRSPRSESGGGPG